MGIETAVAVGGSLLASSMAGDAADTQAAAAGQANALTEQQYNQMRQDLSGYRFTGQAANNLLAQYLGIPGSVAYRNAKGDLYQAEKGTRGAQWRPSDMAVLDYINKNPEKYGMSGGGQFGSLLDNFTGEDLQNEPGYQFGLNQGQQALDRRAAGSGNYFSGSALKAAQRYGNDYASTKYNDAYNRDASNKNRIYSMLSGVSGQGQNAAAMTGQAGMAAANTMGQNLIGAGNTQASGMVGQANALTGGLNNAIGAYQWNQFLGQRPRTPTTNYFGWSGMNGFGDSFGTSEGE